ncbi:hypothetical protein ACFLV0_00565 [Chloroflexota bacterium]
MELRSEKVHVDDALAAVEIFFERKWSDGLAIVPPTEEAVGEMIEYVGRDPQETLGEIPPYGGLATIEKVAINSVMAGCHPEYFPVVIAAVEAVLDPKHNLNGTQTTQSGTEQLIIVNGPITKNLGINYEDGVFGRGYRANGTIGRALRLILWNLGRNFPGDPDKSTFSHPGSWSFCIAENEEASPWEPLHIERGLPSGSSGVTVFCCEAPNPFLTFGTVKQILFATCEALANPNSGNHIFFYEGELLVVFSALIAEQFRREGWSKQDVKKHIWEYARLPYCKIEGGGMLTASFLGVSNVADLWWPKWIDRSDPNTLVPVTATPEDIHVIVCGGRGTWSAICHGWGLGGRAVTREVKLPLAPLSQRKVSKGKMVTEVLSPVSAKKRAKARLELAPRLANLTGKVIGVIDNGKGKSYFDRLEQLLEEKCQPAQIVHKAKPHTHLYQAAPTEFIEEMAKTCSAVILGVGT